jgi:hypothetical protein
MDRTATPHVGSNTAPPTLLQEKTMKRSTRKTDKAATKKAQVAFAHRKLVEITKALMTVENAMYDLEDNEVVLVGVQKRQMGSIVQDIRNLLETAEGI